jgi:hypothetical protein
MAKESSKSLIQSMKDQVSRAGNSKSNIIYVKSGTKKRIRFIDDMEDGHKILFHDKWGEFTTPCLKYYKKTCPYCNIKDARHTENYAWTIYDYESKQRLLFLFKANKNSPIPRMIEVYDELGTLVDRDFTISRTGAGTDTSYGILPLDKAKFGKSKSIVSYTRKEIFAILEEAFTSKLETIDVDFEFEVIQALEDEIKSLSLQSQ